MSKRASILVLTSTFPRWREDRDPPFVYDLCRQLAESFRITVLAPHFPNARARENFDGMLVFRYRYFLPPLERLAYGEGGGILARIRSNPSYGALIPFFLVGQLAALIRLLQQRDFDCIHAHWLIPQGLVGTIGTAIVRQNTPLLCTSHGSDLYSLRGPAMDALRRCVLNRTSAMTVVSQGMAEYMSRHGVGADKIHVVPMGTDLTNRFYPSTERANQEQVLFVGRLVIGKGVRYLIEAWSSVVAEHNEARLLIVGDGPERPHLEQMCKDKGLSKSIEFLGAVRHEKLPDLYRSSGIVVAPSIGNEGFGLVLVEALGCECGVVATDIQALREIVKDGETGLIVTQRDAGSLAGAISKLLSDVELCRRLARNGREFVLGRFGWPTITERYRCLLESMMEGK